MGIFNTDVKEIKQEIDDLKKNLILLNMAFMSKNKSPKNATDEKISQLPDAVTFSPGDILPIARSGSNFGVTQAEVLAATHTVSPSLSPYQAALDGIGTLPNHYTDLSTAYADNKTFLYTIANITEGPSVTMNATDQIFLQVGQNFAWSLNTAQIIGSSANSFGISLDDGSSMFRYTYTSSNLPFSSFDANSTLYFHGNGGTFQNNSTVSNTYIYGLGTVLADDIFFLLPNASAGGFKTDLYTSLNDINFVGGGSSCDTAIICNGGSISNLIFSGSWANNAFLNDVTTAGTSLNTLYVDINSPVSFKILGNATNIVSNPLNLAGFLSLSIYSNSSLTLCYADAVVLDSGVVNAKFTNSNIGSASFAVDNSNQADFVGVYFTNNVEVYGSITFANCHFLGGITVMTGATAKFTACDSSTALVNHGTVIRAANDSNIGNDGGGSVSSVFTRTGAVVSASGDYTASQITNTPAGGISATDAQAALNGLDTAKANLASPTFTGVPAAPTATAGTNTTQLATTAFVTTAVAGGTVPSGTEIFLYSNTASGPVNSGTTINTMDAQTVTGITSGKTLLVDVSAGFQGNSALGVTLTLYKDGVSIFTIDCACNSIHIQPRLIVKTVASATSHVFTATAAISVGTGILSVDSNDSFAITVEQIQ